MILLCRVGGKIVWKKDYNWLQKKYMLKKRKYKKTIFPTPLWIALTYKK